MKTMTWLATGFLIASPLWADIVLEPGGDQTGWTLNVADSIVAGGTQIFRVQSSDGVDIARISSPEMEFAKGATACISVTYNTTVTDSGNDRGTWVPVFCKDENSTEPVMRGYVLPPTDGWATEKILIPMAAPATLWLQLRLQQRQGILDVKQISIAEATPENSVRIWKFESGNGSLKTQSAIVKTSPEGFKYSMLELQNDNSKDMAAISPPGPLTIQPGKPLELSITYKSSVKESRADAGTWIHAQWANAKGAPSSIPPMILDFAETWKTQTFALNPSEEAESLKFGIRLQQVKGVLEVKEIKLAPVKQAASPADTKAN